MSYYLYVCFLFFIIILFSYINSLPNTESFTSKIRETVRPVIRNTRIISEGFYDKTTSKISNLFRKFGII